MTNYQQLHSLVCLIIWGKGLFIKIINLFILIHALVLILLICVAYFIFNSLDTIRDIFYSIIEFLSEPKKALELFISNTSHILFIPISYWYISIPSIIIIFVLLYYMRQYSFKKRCEKLLKILWKIWGIIEEIIEVFRKKIFIKDMWKNME